MCWIDLDLGLLLKTDFTMYCRHNVVTNCPFVWEKALEEQRKELKLKLSQSDVKLVSELDFRTRAATMYQRAHLVHGKMYCRWWKAHPSRQVP